MKTKRLDERQRCMVEAEVDSALALARSFARSRGIRWMTPDIEGYAMWALCDAGTRVDPQRPEARGYLLKSVKWRLMKWADRMRRGPRVVPWDDLSDSETVDRRSSSDDGRGPVRDALAGMDPMRREAIRLRSAGMPWPAIAEELGRSSRTVRGYYESGIAMMRDLVAGGVS